MSPSVMPSITVKEKDITSHLLLWSVSIENWDELLNHPTSVWINDIHEDHLCSCGAVWRYWFMSAFCYLPPPLDLGIFWDIPPFPPPVPYRSGVLGRGVSPPSPNPQLHPHPPPDRIGEMTSKYPLLVLSIPVKEKYLSYCISLWLVSLKRFGGEMLNHPTSVWINEGHVYHIWYCGSVALKHNTLTSRHWGILHQDYN